VKTGFKNATYMNMDNDLDPLRNREDFKKLLADFNARGDAGKKP
jgi:hypothetical protein